MSRELLQQALDALQTNNAWLDYAAPQYVLDRNNQAIAALEQELAKPEQQFYPDWDMIKPFHERIAELEEQLAKPEQEPVAWITDNYEQDRSATTYSAEMANRWRDKGWQVAPLYTAPPRKEWVGLTDEEVMDAYCETPPFCTYTEAFIAGIRFIEAKLKELNK
jgi:hypothetical protein